MTKKITNNADGEMLKPPPDDSDVAQIIYLLEWGRMRGFVLGPTIQVGETIVQVTDPVLERRVKADATSSNPRPATIWEEAGYDGE